MSPSNLCLKFNDKQPEEVLSKTVYDLRWLKWTIVIQSLKMGMAEILLLIIFLQQAKRFP